jgi:hypothetical protein
MAIVFQPALEPLLEPTVHLLDLLGHEGASIRKCQNTYGRHGQCPFPDAGRLKQDGSSRQRVHAGA